MCLRLAREVVRNLAQLFGTGPPRPPEVRFGRDGLAEAALHARLPFRDLEAESEEFLRARFERASTLQILARIKGLRYARAELLQPEAEALAAVPEALAQKHISLPYVIFGGALCLVMADPDDLQAIDEIGRASRLRIVPVLGEKEQILKAVKRAYSLPALKQS